MEPFDPARPLAGLLVIALEQAVAAPFASSRLADAGARVIKIERPEGDFARAYDSVAGGESAYFVWLNRGKESLVLDIKDASDAALLHRMIARADVFIQNLAPAAAARAGFGAERLRREHPRLITCDISGYGDSGPLRDMKAYDLLVQAETGLCSVTGNPAGPGRVGVSVCDIAAGLYAHAAILEALYARARGAGGASLRVSLFDSMADWMTVPLLYQEHTGRPPPRAGLHHPSIAPYGSYPCADGDIVIAIQNEREWARFCAQVIGQAPLAQDAEFAGNEQRVRNRPRLDAIIHEAFRGATREAIAARLRDAGIAFGSLNSVADLARHPQLRRVDIATPAGTIPLVAPPAQSDTPRAAPAPVPRLGEHGACLRREFAC